MRVVTRLNVGGPTRQIASLMSRLDPGRFAQILVSGRASEDESEDLIPVTGQRIRIDELRRPIAPGADFRAYRNLVALFRRERPAIVHTHHAKAGWIGRMAAASAGVPVIVHTYHGHTFREYFRWPKSAVLRALERRAALSSTALIAQAESQRDDVGTFLGPAARERTRVIPPGIELPPDVPEPRNDSRRILFPGRLEPVKDPMLALDVLARLPEEFTMHVFGGGSLQGSVEGRLRADRGLMRRVVIRPATADRSVLFGTAGVTMLTSRAEGTPLALLESQVFGVPVVAPDVGAVRSVVAPGGGTVVATRDAAALAAAVMEVAGRPVPPASVAWVRERFSAERLAADVARLYEELLSRVSGG
jgi:glycosyltransferase involved in cell wall biosynthesis